MMSVKYPTGWLAHGTHVTASEKIIPASALT